LITTYDRRNAPSKIPILMHYLRTGSTVMLVSNAGTPCLYDPGFRLVAHAHRAGIPIVSVPGPSALTAALAIAGMSGDALCFHGHFPASETGGKRLLRFIKTHGGTSMFFVWPQRLRKILILAEKVLGNRETTIAVDLTKTTERVLRGKIRNLLGKYPLDYPDTDITLVIAGR
jgi:16S rRNA (cytidine1402-2'-O)-methyltransferase